jgi:hypothetical protein
VTTVQFDWRGLTASFLVGLSLLAMPDVVRAQQVDSMHIAVGSRILVRMRDGTEGRWQFIRASPEGLMLTRHIQGGDQQRVVPWSEAERVDTVVVGQPSGRRMLAGGVAGGFFGVLAVVFASGAAGPCHWDNGSCPGFGVALVAPAFVGTGIFTGAYLGLRRRPWHWSTAWRASASPTPGSH